MAEQGGASSAAPCDNGSEKRRCFTRDKQSKTAASTSGPVAEAVSGAKSLQQVLDSLDPDKPESVRDLVDSFNDGKFAERTKKAQASAYDRYYLPLCEKMKWDMEGELSSDRIKLLAATLEQVANIRNSRHVVFANIKAKVAVRRPLSDEAMREYTSCFAILKKSIVEQQEHPVMISWWEQADKIRTGSPEARCAISKTKTLCLGQFLDFCVAAWFLMQRPDEFKDLDRSCYTQSGEQRAHFFLRKSKVDQRGRGWSARMRCCCAEVKSLGLKRKLCPVHACDQQVWTAFANTPAPTLRKCMAEVTSRLGLTETSACGRALWNLYSFRVGGASAAKQGGLSQEDVQMIGRWKNSKTALGYQGDRSVNVTEAKAIAWPVVRAEQLKAVGET
eukprot:g9714.t1